MPDKYAILQLKRTDETARERFMSLAWLREQGLQPKPEQYELAYAGKLTLGDADDLTQTEAEQYALEKLFAKFNLHLPPDFAGHSMSVSDIVAVLTGGKATKYYYCDSYGFKRLTGFRHRSVERMLEARK
ncbi:MAG: YodL domain-containing protein [Clostridiales bacterium]|nr:YodL domain-containing protein [Clostridiales bacterium]